MSGGAGYPSWYELPCADPDAAATFYAHVVGWSFSSSPTAPVEYRVGTIPAGQATVGLLGVAAECSTGALPRWLTYFDVADVDATVAAAQAAGATVQMPATDIDGIGRLAMIADPEGNPFYLIHRLGNEPPAFNCAMDAPPGSAVWNEVSAVNSDGLLAFYRDLLGWRQDGAMPMGELGEYRFLFAGETGIGAIMTVPPDGRPGWMPYFLVDDADAAVRRIGEAGGTMLQGPDPIPGDMFAIVTADPTGARFGLVGPRRA